MIGAGNFGTVLANILAENGCRVKLWLRDEAQLQEMLEKRENVRYLPGHKLAAGVEPTSSLADASDDAVLFLLTVPSTSFREVARSVAPHVQAGAYVVSGTKGVEATNFSLMSQILSEEIEQGIVGVLSGPNLAEEIADGLFAGTVIASKDNDLISTVQRYLQNTRFRVYGNNDIYGVELGGALKNIYAIICGMATTIDVGQNALAMVITRSLAEMNRFAQSMGANAMTFLGLSGVGDLLATCTSTHSRNFRLGAYVATGLTVDQAQDKLGKLAEGVNTIQVVYAKKQELGVYMPLVDGVYRVLFEQASIPNVISELMLTSHQPDVDRI